MNLNDLPEFPAKLSAKVLARELIDQSAEQCADIYTDCLKAIAHRIFPCTVPISCETQVAAINCVVCRLEEGGYFVHTIKINRDFYIKIVNPHVKSIAESDRVD